MNRIIPSTDVKDIVEKTGIGKNSPRIWTPYIGTSEK
jgi:hypothetical protein